MAWTANSWISAAAASTVGLEGYVAVFAVALAIAILFMTMRGRRRGEGMRMDPRDFAREQLSKIREDMASTRPSGLDQVDNLRAQREIDAQIESKFAKLGVAIGDADRRIARLTDLLNRAERLGITPDEEQNVELLVIQALAHAGRTPSQIADQLGRSTEEIDAILKACGEVRLNGAQP
jgi:hypothetical protein